MMTPKKLFLRCRSKSFRDHESYRCNERGGVTVEFVLWAPVFAALIAGATDITLAFMNQSNFWNVARDTARAISRHAMDETQGEVYAEANAAFANAAPDAVVRCVDGDDNTVACENVAARQVIVTITAPATTIDAFGIFGIFKDTTIKAEVRHKMEPK